MEKKRIVYFSDAAHFVLAGFQGSLWSLERVFVKTPAGRNRLNILGAVNAISKEVLYVSNDSFVNSDTVRQLLDKIAEQRHMCPVTIVLDNARYQRCLHVTDYASSLGIEILFLPPYSPNLNLIERLWRFVKKTCLNSIYYQKFNLFCSAILSCLDAISSLHKESISSLLSLNFQIIKM